MLASGSDSDSDSAGPSNNAALQLPASRSEAADAAGPAADTAGSESAARSADAAVREDWMTKSFPKAAANADALPLPGAKPEDQKVHLITSTA